MQQLIWYSADTWNAASGGQPLFRGFRYPSLNLSIDIQSPSNRLPVNMPEDIQKRIDDWFFDRFKMRFRESSIFATGDQQTAKSYAGDWGQVRQLEPKENFCFCWSPKSADLYNEFENLSHSESLEDLLDRLNFKCDELETAIRSGHEIMLVCSSVKAILMS